MNAANMSTPLRSPQQPRRRTLLNSPDSVSTIEQSKNLKMFLDIYHDNKLSHDNAWSISAIDALAALTAKHHKSLDNFKVAGSSLEASSKLYGLRVDAVHTDVLRMAAGLNARKFREIIDSITTVDDENGDAIANQIPQEIRRRKVVATIAKNPRSLNAHLDTVPLPDPLFSKMNSINEYINASNRLMNNILPTVSGGLQLRQTQKYWDASSSVEENCDFTAPVPFEEMMTQQALLPCDGLTKLNSYDNLLLRPVNSGYIITDTPVTNPDDEKDTSASAAASPVNNMLDDISMTFDMNAECEPLPDLTAYAPLAAAAIDEQLDDFNADKRNAILELRGLHQVREAITDLRPIDATSNLEYTYRPVEKISQFWAGPSFWKFRRPRQPDTTQQTGATRKQRKQALLSKKQRKVPFGDVHEELFVDRGACKLHAKRTWSNNLTLPNNEQLNAKNLFGKYIFAPGILMRVAGSRNSDDEHDANGEPALPDAENDELSLYHFNRVDEFDVGAVGGDEFDVGALNVGATAQDLEANANNTTFEIATDFENAPRQVTKFVVPFAKRAKVINMKRLKRYCTESITKQMENCALDEFELARDASKPDEAYVEGQAKFRKMYEELPSLVPSKMAEGLSPSIAFNAVLQAANDNRYRLIQQASLEDFIIRQIHELSHVI